MGNRKRRELTRRELIELGARGTAALGLSQVLGPASAFAAPESRTVHGACYHDCPDACSWTVTAVDGRITQFGASKTNPYTDGKLCGKMDHFPEDVTFHPDRILTPLKRTGKKGKGEFTPITWKQALDEIAARLKAVVAEKGKESVLPYSFAGTEGLVQNNALSSRFFAHIGATRLERNICGDAAVAGVMAANGDTTGVLPDDIIHSRHIILWGTNPVVSNQHLWSLILKARQSGAKVVAIDPFQSATTQLADLHIQPMPGTDVVLALSLMQVILSENLQDRDYIEKYTTGIGQLTAHVQQYAPPAAAKITGVDAQTIVSLAREYAAAKPSLLRILIGLEKHATGPDACRAVAMLPALTGAWRHRGGGLMHFTYEPFGKALNWDRVALGKTMEDPNTRSVNMIQLGRALTDPSMKPPIHALFVYNSNPAVIAPDQNRVLKGLEREDLLTVVLEHFVTDTARYADYVLPATTQLEHWDLMDSWGQTRLNLNQPVIPPRGESKPNSEIFRMLARAMGYTEDSLYESDLDIIKATLKSTHPYMKGITFESLVQSGWANLKLPDPWIPHAEGNFATPSKKCEFWIEPAKGSTVPPLPEYRPASFTDEEFKKYPLQLLTIKSTQNFLNTSHANVRHLLQKEGQPFLDIHETDAKARGIADGDTVKVWNARGRMLLTARIKNKVRPGVVCLPQGYWTSLLNGGSSANALTPDLLTGMGGGAALQDARVEVMKA